MFDRIIHYWSDWNQTWARIPAATPMNFNSLPYGFSATELTWAPETHHVSNHLMGNAIDFAYSPSMLRMLKNKIRSKYDLTERWTDWDADTWSWPQRDPLPPIERRISDRMVLVMFDNQGVVD